LERSDKGQEIRSEPRVAASGAQQVQHELKARKTLSGLERSGKGQEIRREPRVAASCTQQVLHATSAA